MGQFMSFQYLDDCIDSGFSIVPPATPLIDSRGLAQALICAIIYEKEQYKDSSFLHPEYLTKFLLKDYEMLDCAIVNSRYEHFDQELFRKEEIQIDSRPLTYSFTCLKQTLLTLAAKYSSPTVFACLLEHPEIDPNMSNDEGDAPLHIATQLGRMNIVACLLNDSRTDIEKKDGHGRTARRLSVIHRYAEMEELFIKTSADQTEAAVLESFRGPKR
jgi:hypothetical protein